jgi:hypothetical protein
MALLVAAALAGLFGGGALGEASVASADGSLRVDYPRFWRARSPDIVKLDFTPAGSGVARIWLDRQYVRDDVSVEDISPPPQRVALGGDRIVYEFDLADAARPVSVALRVRAEHGGALRGRVGIEGGAALELRQFVFP